MIQNINPHKFDLTYGQPKAQDEDFVLYIKKSKTLLRKVDEENHEIPKFSDFPEDKELLKESAYYLFAIDGNHYYYVMIKRAPKNVIGIVMTTIAPN